MSLIRAKELVAIVRSTEVSPVDYDGLSDHKVHSQLITTPMGPKIRVASFNVLNPGWLKYINGLGALPNGMDMRNQAQLHNRPFCQPENQERRRKRIMVVILSILDSHWDDGYPVVLCLQECDITLFNELEAMRMKLGRFKMEVQRRFGSEPDHTAKDFCIILTTGLNDLGEVQAIPIKDAQTINIELGGYRFWIANVHWGFGTDNAKQSFTEIVSSIPQGADLLVVGDFNVQAKALSKQLIEEGICRETLDQFVQWVEDFFQRGARVCLHPRHWTCWNIVGNCADQPYDMEDPAYRFNCDHLDNIMVVSQSVGRWSAKGENIIDDVF
jgi:hypothetical protein